MNGFWEMYVGIAAVTAILWVPFGVMYAVEEKKTLGVALSSIALCMVLWPLSLLVLAFGLTKGES